MACQSEPSHRAMLTAVLPSARLKSPPAIKSPPNTERALTSAFVPSPSADQPTPFQRAIFDASTPPIWLNRPPTTTSPWYSTMQRISPSETGRPNDDDHRLSPGMGGLARWNGVSVERPLPTANGGF